ncbi:MAG: hypothetical protein EU539_06895 [Promethearchaeota archaeon]|nr:MAG: hypothetical protein EU539_06895 [Candidatus Lokiarchaeota archaeon]
MLFYFMLNHRLIEAPREPERFVEMAVEFINKHSQDKKVFCALSGGIDSALTYLLLKKAKVNVIPVFIDHGLMRLIRGIEEREHVKKLFPDVIIVDIRKEFLPKIFGVADAEEKRKLFKNAYSEIISKVIKDESCDLLADGTILPDIEESFGIKISDLKETMSVQQERKLMEENINGFIKSQHNLNIEYEVEATIQPVASLTKHEVRKILKYLNMPPELIYRKAFPGPALSARIIGPVNKENLSFEKKVHDIVESSVEEFYNENYGTPMIINDRNQQEPFQVFAAIGLNILNSKVTGVFKGKRIYEVPLCVRCQWDHTKLTKNASHLVGYSRMLYELDFQDKGVYDVIIRSINSKDARTAEVTNLPFTLMANLREKILEFPETKAIFYDVTPKPPATIEYV